VTVERKAEDRYVSGVRAVIGVSNENPRKL
jgi:hypothetical protein